jgi:hypothetical protein
MIQSTRYPWDGQVRIAVNPDQTAALTVKVRIPGWARNQPVASDLYRYADKPAGAPSLKVNGRTVPLEIDKGYATLTRTWRAGDVIDVSLPMQVRRVIANQQVTADRGRVALERGPLVYALEWTDNPNGKVRNLMLPDTEPLRAERSTLLDGVTVVKTNAASLSYDAQGHVAKTPAQVTAIPYYAWANRGRGQMIVWIPNSEASARPAPYPTVAMTARVTVSGKSNKNPRNINDGEEPATSNDPSSYFDWWPVKGAQEWVEYAFEKPATVSECELYWFDDTGRGQVRVPASWQLLYKDGNDWKPVENHSPYGVEKDRYNEVTFAPVQTTGLRLELTMQPNWSAGVQKWKAR